VRFNFIRFGLVLEGAVKKREREPAATRRGSKPATPKPYDRPMRFPKVGPPVPMGYLNVEEWGRLTGRGKVAAYAAVKRGEVETENYGVTCIREDWRERNAARAAKEAEERRQVHCQGRVPSSNPAG
jgi:hypothetical protein